MMTLGEVSPGGVRRLSEPFAILCIEAEERSVFVMIGSLITRKSAKGLEGRTQATKKDEPRRKELKS